MGCVGLCGMLAAVFWVSWSLVVVLCVLVASDLLPCLFGVFPVLSWFSIAEVWVVGYCVFACVLQLRVCGLDAVLYSLWYC